MVFYVKEFAPPSSFDAALVKKAVVDWHNESFSDADVTRVKDLFRAVFGVHQDLQLKGTTAMDALIIHPPEDMEKDTVRMYAMQVKASGDIRWVHWVMSVGTCFSLGESLDDILEVMELSERSG
jgi:hypothetical protein